MSGKIIGISDGSTTITATHKVTGRVKSFIANINTTKIFQYYRLPGLDENGIAEAPDMVTNNKSRLELYNMSLLLGDLGNLYDEDFPIQGPEELYSNMCELAYLFTINDSSMTTVANEMISHFLDGSGTPYSNTTLTNRAYNNLSTQNLISSTTSVINNYMQAYNGEIEAFYTSNVFYNDIQAVGRAHYNNPDDMWNGLKICINDTWGYYLTLEQCSISNNNYSMSIRYTIYDHFGLNDADITGNNWYLGYTNQFGSWYVLQHYTGCNNQYRPFITYIEFIKTISGTLS